MHILYLHQYFATRSGFTGTRSYELSRQLIARGHRVTMIASGRACEKELEVPEGKQFIETDVDGIHVVPIAAGYNNPHKGTGLGGAERMRHFLKFARLATRVGKQLERPDIVFATHTPLTIGLAGMRLARHFDVPFVFEVRDVWPDALVNCGALSNPLVIWWLRRMARKIYAASDHIVALSPGMKEGVVQTGVAPERVTVITNGSDMDLFSPHVDGGPARQRLGLDDRFAAVYFGAMGQANGLDYAVHAAQVLKERGRDNIVIILHGGGGKRTELQSLANRLNLDNVIFSDLVPDKSAVAGIVAACNACLTIYAQTRQEQSWSPNKMFDALAAGRPVLVNVPGWLADLVESNGCGRFVNPDQPASLADALTELSERPDLCVEMGRNSRQLAEREFSREVLASRLEKVLENAIRGH